MTTVNINITNIASSNHPDDRVVFYSPANRNEQGVIISTAVQEVPLANGVGTVDLVPGAVVVRFECLGISDTKEKPGHVPETGPVTLSDVILDWTPALVDQGILAILAATEDALSQVDSSVAASMDGVRAEMRGEMVPREIWADSLIGDGGKFQNRTPWEGVGGALEHIQSTAKVTGDGSSAVVGTRRAVGFIPTISAGHVLYVRVQLRSESTSCQAVRVKITSATGEVVVKNIDLPPHLAWQQIDELVTVPSAWGTGPVNIVMEGVWADAAASSGQAVSAYGLTWLDVTATYGAGNEPSHAHITRQKTTRFPNTVIFERVLWDTNLGQVWRDELSDLSADISADLQAVEAGVSQKIAIESYPRTVSVTNMLGNGYISQPAWVALTGSVLSIGGGSGIATSSGTTSPLGMKRVAPIVAAEGDVLWVGGYMRARNFQATAYRVTLSDGVNQVSMSVGNPPNLAWTDLLGVVTVPASLAGKSLTVSVAAESTAIISGSIFEVYRIAVINLTASYGAGREPNVNRVAALAALQPSGRINGTIQNFETDPIVVTRNALPDLVADALPDITGGMVETALVGKLPAREDFHPSKPGVILRFDDGYTSNLELAAPVLKEHGFRGYLAMATRWQGQRPGGVVMQPAQVQQLHSEFGWEIGSHTSEHMDAVGHPDFVRGLNESLADLISWGFYGDTFTYPNGSRTKQTDREVYLRFPKCQLTGAPEVTPTPHDAPTFFTGWAVVQGNASTSAKELQFSRMKNYVMESLRRGHVATLGFHGIEMTAPTTVAYNLDLPTFTRIIEWLAAEGIPVIRPRDMPPHNLVGDAGFNHYEVHPWGTSGAHPWGVSPYAVADRWQRVTTGQYSGVACMALTASTAKSTSFEQGISVEPGKKYRVHTLAKANLTAGTVTVEVQPKNLLNEPVGAVIVGNTITSASWADHAFEVTIPAGAAMVTLTVRATGAVGTASVDHVAMMDANIYDPLAI